MIWLRWLVFWFYFVDMLSFLHIKLFSSHRYICWVYNSKLEVIFPENFWLHYLLAFRTAVENSNAIVILDFSL